MTGNANRTTRMLWMVLIGTAILMMTACSALKSKESTSSTSTARSTAAAKSKTKYYDFGDVLLPSELKVNSDNSFVFSASGLTAGVLSLKGRVTIPSLIIFFENKMPRDGWQLVNKFTGLRNMLLFKKQDRYCTITLDDGQLSTIVEIWVAPTMHGSGQGLHR